jgi:c(7)-type cytochrome triheme protein
MHVNCLKGLRLILLIFLAVCAPLTESGAIQPYDSYGRVVIGNFSPKAGMAKVVFDHWLHRAQFTCRVCHVDIGFLMEKGATRIKAADNMKGFYCGACHNGKMQTYEGPVFKACSIPPAPDEMARCNICHSFGKDVQKKYEFTRFTEKMPKSSLGNGIDWEKAETSGLIAPKDYVQGASIRKQAMPDQKDFSLNSKSSWMGNILFSHKKHTKWNGCEMCHPEIFIGVSKGATKYNMIQIYGGEYCGACHLKVAFPLQDCSRCHVKPVR